MALVECHQVPVEIKIHKTGIEGTLSFFQYKIIDFVFPSAHAQGAGSLCLSSCSSAACLDLFEREARFGAASLLHKSFGLCSLILTSS